ncbi:PD-(D/E)XK nuclease family protein [Limosilactobacillus fermentum]|nr:PD-(D/E)XK nuclease family protein [Limosilactobacillus fermentum]
MLLSAHDLFSGIGATDDSEVLIHGIIDGYVQHDDQIDLFDYKTDRISQAHPEEDLQELADKYSGQLVLYADALTKMTGFP